MADQPLGPRNGALSRRRAALTDHVRQRYAGHRSALASQAEVRRGSRKRGWIMGVAGLAGLATMLQLVSTSAMAVNFSTMNSPMQVYTNYLQGEQVAAYLNRSSRKSGSDVPVAELGVKTASLAGLCIITSEKVGGLGSYSVVLTAGESVPGSFANQTGLALTNANYGLPAGWVAGTDVWGTNGVADDEYIGALKGARKTNAVQASDLFLNAQRLGGAGYKVSGMYLGERAQDVGPNSGVGWETAEPGSAPAPPSSGGGFGLRVEHFNLAGGSMSKPDDQATGSGSISGVAGGSDGTNQGADKLADVNPDTKWFRIATSTSIDYSLTERVRVTRYSLTSGNDSPLRDPRNFSLLGSNTSGGPWTTLHSVSNQGSFAARKMIRTYDIPTPGSYQYYRLSITGAQSGTDGVQLADWSLGEVGGPVAMASAAEVKFVTSPSGTTGTGSETVDKIADANSATKWHMGVNSFPGGVFAAGRTARYQLAMPARILSYSLTSANDSPGRDPRDFTVRGSNDGTNWTTLDTVTGNTFASRFQTKSFDIDSPGVYAYYLLSVTAVQSGTTESQLADWTLGPADPTVVAPTGDGAVYGLRLKGSILLPKLKIQIVPGVKNQSYCPTAAG